MSTNRSSDSDRGRGPASPSGRDGSGAPGAHHASAAPAGSVADAPAVRLPALHFTAALLFLVLGAAGLLWQTPALAVGSFSSPGVIGSLHLLTLGWIGTSIIGASTQLLPVALGAPLRWEGLGYATFAAWTAGTAAFAVGVATSVSTLYLIGAGAVGAGAVLFAVQLWATLPRAPVRDLTWWSLAGSALFLLGGWVLGLLLAVNLTAGILGPTRYSVLVVHLHLAAGGWVLLTMIGVAHRLLPRFLGSRSAPAWPGRLAAGLTATGSVLLLASEHILPAGVIRVGLWALVGGAVAFGIQGLVHFRGRRRAPGSAMALAGAGLLGLVLAAAAGAALLVDDAPDARLATAYGLLLIPGGMALFVAGFEGRIVRFLARLHGVEAGELDDHPGRRLRPRTRTRLGAWGAALLVAGASALVAGVLPGIQGLTGVGAAAYGIGAVLLATDLLPMSWRLAFRSPEGPHRR